MNSETKTCQNCKKDFTIEPEDFNFYEKIKVPPPTWCPECRRQRRWVWRNERNWYKRKCNAKGHNEDMISLYDPEKNFTVYDQKYWWGDGWDALDYGQDYDFSKPFFEQYKELLSKIPFLTLSNTQAVNSEYCSSAACNKDCYLITAGGWNERVLYSNRPARSKDSMDLYIVDSSELCYDSLYCYRCYLVSFSRECENCNDSMFLYNCKNCQNCFACSNLRGKNYCFFNKQLTKDKYEEEIKKLNFSNWKNLQDIKEKFYKEIYIKTIHKYSDLVNSKNSTGDHLRNTKNCHECYDFAGDNNEDCRYVDWSGFISKDLYDTGPGVGWQTELAYESIDCGLGDFNIISNIVCYSVSNCFYSAYIQSSDNIFGCHGLHSKQYCILNKQYTKEEYEELVPKIIQHMNDIPYVDKKGRVYKYGEFFPSELSPFSYNETIAQEYFPLTKEEAIEQGYSWKEKEERNYTIDIKTEDIPNDIKDVDDSILNKIIECSHKDCNHQCTEAFKIIPNELSFYKRMNLPIPHLCPNCRHYERLSQRNPLKLWHRKCMKDNCPNEFETSYAPDRPEIVYCEKCYQQEVY